jgi:hypothetical protein
MADIISQAEQDRQNVRQNRTATRRQAQQYCQDRATKTGLPDRVAWAVLPREDCTGLSRSVC